MNTSSDKKNFIGKQLSLISISAIVIYALCLLITKVGAAAKIIPPGNVIVHNAPVLKVSFTESFSLEKRYVIASDNGESSIEVYDSQNDGADLILRSINLTGETVADYSILTKSQQKGEGLGDKYTKLMTNANFVLTLEVGEDVGSLTYDFESIGNKITLSGFSDGIRIFLSSTEEIEYSRPQDVEALQERRFEILNCSKISFEADTVIFDGMGYEKEIESFSHFGIVSGVKNIEFCGETYYNVNGTCYPGSGVATVKINPLNIYINAELKAASSGTQNILPNEWLAPLSLAANKKLEAIAAFFAVYGVIDTVLNKYKKEPEENPENP